MENLVPPGQNVWFQTSTHKIFQDKVNVITGDLENSVIVKKNQTSVCYVMTQANVIFRIGTEEHVLDKVVHALGSLINPNALSAAFFDPVHIEVLNAFRAGGYAAPKVGGVATELSGHEDGFEV